MIHKEHISQRLLCVRFASVPGYLVFFAGWLFLLICTMAYFLIVIRSVLYFLGICFYVPVMVKDLAVALDDLDKSLRDRSNRSQVLACEIRFHNEIIEYLLFFSRTRSTLGASSQFNRAHR